MKKIGKVITSVILSIIMAVEIEPINISAMRVEKMSVNDISNVVGSFTVGTQVTAVEEGYYEFSVPSNGKLQIQESSREYGYHIYTGTNKEIVGGVKDKYWIRLSAGIYYVYMKENDSLTLSFTDESSDNYEKEKNDSFDLANEIQVNQIYIGNSQISCSELYKERHIDNGYVVDSSWSYYCGDGDYYHFLLNQKGTIYIDFSQIHNQDDRGHILELYQEDSVGNFTTVLSEGILINNGTTTRVRVSAGSYYFKVYSGGLYDSANLQDYSFQVCYQEEGDTTELEPNNTREQANEINVNTSYAGNIASTDKALDEDWYKVNLEKECYGRIKFTIPRQTANGMFTVELYSSLGIKMDSFKTTENPVSYNSDSPKKYSAGIYYIRVFGTNDTEYEISSDSFIDYSLQFIDSAIEEDKTENIGMTETVNNDTIFNIDDTDLVAYIPKETLIVGETENIIFNQSLNCNYNISVENEGIVYVDEMGVLHAVSQGNTTITIYTDIGKTANFNITVVPSTQSNYEDNFGSNDTNKENDKNIKLPKNYSIFTSRKKFDKENYVTKITFKNGMLVLEGNFYIYNKAGYPIAVGSRLSTKIKSNCKFYYGENKISLKKMKKLIKKAGNNCIISFGATIKNKKIVSMGLYS